MNRENSEQLDPAKVRQLTLEKARDFMKNKRGRQYWRSLEQLARRDDFGAMLEEEIPRQGAAFDPVDRRDFLRFMGASLAIGGLTACTRQPPERIVPYVKPPEEMIPGKPMFFATSMPLGGYGHGLVMTSNMGRPTKAEGNPNHPASLGATSVFGQASIYSMFDPDRSQNILNRGRPGSWELFLKELEEALDGVAPEGGAGLRILSETITSPALAAQMKEFQTKFPQAKWIQYEPVNRENFHAGARLAFGAFFDTVYHLDKAKIIVALDSDFLSFGPGHVRYARDFAAGRNVLGDPAAIEMNRLYAIETGLTVTGASADHRLAVAPSHIEGIARAIARGVGIEVAGDDAHGAETFVQAVVKDLRANVGRAVVIAGEHLPPMIQALAHAINDMLKARGSTVTQHFPVAVKADYQTLSLKILAQEMDAGKIDAIIVLGGNPVYYAPADLKFAEAFNKVKFRVHLGLYADETAQQCHWHIPEAHFLEAWGDVRAFDGTSSVVQPLIEPLYGGKSIHEMVATILGRSSKKSYEIIKEFWKSRLSAGDTEFNWRKTLHDGFVAGSPGPAIKPLIRSAFLALPPAPAPAVGIELVFAPDYSAYDGRFANNGWLQELPRSTTKIVWDNALLVGTKTAEIKGWKDGDVVGLSTSAGKINVPISRVPGITENVAILNLGYGRTTGGRVLKDCGFNTYAIRSSTQPWFTTAAAAATGGKYEIVTTQHQHEMQEMGDPQETTISEFRKKPDFLLRHYYRDSSLADYQKRPKESFTQEVEESEKDKKTGKVVSIYPDFDYSKGNQWGMVINLNTCIGCNACMIACVAENNISVVGKDQTRRQRSMHWIRVDRYFSGDKNAPTVSFQPVPCQQCEEAPCETVCPVAATTHSREGLNQMVYNRCVGTRYCSNNCPYKVRRFNFYKFADHETPSFKLMRNPNVTVRSRGVMEKCTYCIQRIAAARIEGKKKSLADPSRAENNVLPGEVVTACQQVCPTRAIVFGDVNNPKDPIVALKQHQLNYSLFAELATRPRTTYLGRIRNLNPDLEASTPDKEHGKA